MKHSPLSPVAAVVTASVLATVLAGCGGGGGSTAAGAPSPRATQKGGAQPLPSAPDPRSLRVPTGAPAAAHASAQPLPTGPSDRLSPSDLWRRAAAVMAAQKSAALTLDVRADDGAPVHAESSVATDGDCVGHFDVAGGRAQVVHVGQSLYLSGDDAFWAWAARLRGVDLSPRLGRWVSGPLAELGDFGVEAMCALPDAVQNVAADFSGLKQERGPLTLAGRQVMALTQTGDTGTVTLYVALTGPAVVLKAVQRGDTAMTTTFAQLGRPVHAQVPAGVRG